MRCSKCETDLPPGARFCPKCGTDNEAVEPDQPQKRKRSPMIYVIAGLAALALLALVFTVLASRGSVTNAPAGNPAAGRILSAPTGNPGPGNLTNPPPAAPGPGAQNPPALNKPKPPQAVVDYLAYVKKVEDHRQMLLKDSTEALTMATVSGSTQGLLDMIDMAMDPDGAKARDPLQDVKTELNRQYKNWISTLQYFDKKPAPAECRAFSGAYRDVIFKETKTIGELAVNMNAASVNDPKEMSKLLGALQKMKGDRSIQGDIDKAADNADNSLTSLVSNYDMQKPFSVPREQQTSGNIMGF